MYQYNIYVSVWMCALAAFKLAGAISYYIKRTLNFVPKGSGKMFIDIIHPKDGR